MRPCDDCPRFIIDLFSLFFIFQGIFITRVIADGPAADYLQPGDKILEVR